VLEVYENGKVKIEIEPLVPTKPLLWRLFHPNTRVTEIGFREVDEYVPEVKCLRDVCKGDFVCINDKDVTGKVRFIFANGKVRVENDKHLYWTNVKKVSRRST